MKTQIMELNIFLIIGLLFVIVCCSGENNKDVVKSYISAHNAHDIRKALTFYDKDIVFELKGVWTKEGLSEMQSLEKWDSTLDSNLRLESITSKGDSLFCQIIENNDWFRAVNIHDLVHDPAVFVIKNGKITRIIGYPSPETGRAIEEAIGSIYKWSNQVQDTTIKGLIQNGQFVYSSGAAKRWLTLFEKRNAIDSLK